MNRFSRQTHLKGFGELGQQRLRNAKVLVVGAGGLGCPALLYLAAAGIGKLGIVDGDVVNDHNLNRQVLFGVGDIGKWKVESAKERLLNQFDDVNICTYPHYLQKENVIETIRGYDVVIDSTDRFSARYLINDACRILQIPLVMGAIYESEGQIAVFNYGENPIQLRDVFPKMPDEGSIPNCQETGVLGVLSGIIGTMQAAEAIKIITGYGQVLHHEIYLFSLKSLCLTKIQLKPSMNNIGPETLQALYETQYEDACQWVPEISWDEALQWMEKRNVRVIDIREPHELPKLNLPPQQNASVSKLNDKHIESEFPLFVYCQSGKRSHQMVQKLKELNPHEMIYSISGGVLSAPDHLKI